MTSTPTPRRRHLLALAVGTAVSGLILLAATGCATNLPAPRADEPPVAEPAAVVDCRTEGTWMLPDAPPTHDPSIPVPGRVPDGFDAVAALRCDVGTAIEPSDAVVIAQVERFEGDLAPLLAALAEPDDPVPSGLACTADMELVSPLWLEGDDGTLIPVHYPRDACGKTKPAVHDALDGLDVVSVTEVPVPTGD